ncbi:Aste57867_1542 [Aphanomyces stellatus]|uniref:Aste57867_1542 protein n=1 Tax=Aphanomyces stellatus TaxID=120398 RepID=A0A485KAL0_9STRA|nr:hypothetical protein As57867_001541 [Aphanomyces stellatus]VFT78757.1 Aste57867_1542 [Aphanomyces stellatus]
METSYRFLVRSNLHTSWGYSATTRDNGSLVIDAVQLHSPAARAALAPGAIINRVAMQYSPPLEVKWHHDARLVTLSKHLVELIHVGQIVSSSVRTYVEDRWCHSIKKLDAKGMPLHWDLGKRDGPGRSCVDILVAWERRNPVPGSASQLDALAVAPPSHSVKTTVKCASVQETLQLEVLPSVKADPVTSAKNISNAATIAVPVKRARQPRSTSTSSRYLTRLSPDIGWGVTWTTDAGLRVTDVKEGSPAYSAGLTPGTIIRQLNYGQNVSVVTDATEMATRLRDSTKLVEHVVICQRRMLSKHWTARKAAALNLVKRFHNTYFASDTDVSGDSIQAAMAQHLTEWDRTHVDWLGSLLKLV